MSRQLSLLTYFAKRRCGEDDDRVSQASGGSSTSGLSDSDPPQQLQTEHSETEQVTFFSKKHNDIVFTATCFHQATSFQHDDESDDESLEPGRNQQLQLEEQVLHVQSQQIPDDIALTQTSSPCQPMNIVFRKRSYSDRERCFNPAWYHQYPWLEYSAKKDAAFCFPCRLFGSSSIGRGRPEKAFTINGFRDWKHATGSKGSLLSHNNSYTHKQSVITWEQFKVTLSSGTVAEQLGNNRSEMIEKNRHYMKAVSDVLLTCSQQDPTL